MVLKGEKKIIEIQIKRSSLFDGNVVVDGIKSNCLFLFNFNETLKFNFFSYYYSKECGVGVAQKQKNASICFK